MSTQRDTRLDLVVALSVNGSSVLRLRNVSHTTVKCESCLCTADVLRFHTCVQELQNRLISGIVKHCDKRAHIIPVALIWLQVYFRNSSGKYNM